MVIVDSHCHLDMLKDHDDLDNIIQRAVDNDVKFLQTICTRLDNFENILSIAKKYNNVFASVGIHPSDAMEVVDSSKLVELAQHEKVIGLGETGLDYFYNKEKKQKDVQRASFEQHIIASQSNKLPVIIHMREAEDDSFAIINEYMKREEFPALIHCFTASREFARKMLDLGLYISISGIVTFKNAADLQEIVRFIPLDRLLIETDSPYLAPVPKRGKTNEPAYTKYVAQYIADLKQISINEVAEKTTNNFFQLFDRAAKKF